MPQRDFEELIFDVGGNLTTTGSANAYAVQSAQSVSGYYAGLWIRAKANHTNNGASTFAINGLATAPIRKDVTAVLVGGEIVSGRFFDLVYDATNSVFQLQQAIADNAIGNTQLADMAQATIKGRASGAGTGDPTDLSGTQVAVILPDASASQRGVIEHATDAEVRASTTGNTAITPALVESASAGVALTDAATVAVDWDSGINFTLTVTANRAIGNPTNGQPGTYRTIMVQGNDSTDRTLTFGNQYLGEVPVITDCDSGRWYMLVIYCHTSSHFAISSKKANGT